MLELFCQSLSTTEKEFLDIFSDKESFTTSLKVISVALIPAVAVGLFSPLQDIIDSNKNILQITGAAYLIFSIILLFSSKIKDDSNKIFMKSH